MLWNKNICKIYIKEQYARYETLRGAPSDNFWIEIVEVHLELFWK